jgi:hypothetical protein
MDQIEPVRSPPNPISQLLAAASAIAVPGLDWQIVAGVLRDAPCGLADRERCDLLIAGANGESISFDLLCRLVGRRFVWGERGAKAPITLELREWCKQNLSAYFELDETGRAAFAEACHRDLRGKVLVAPGYDDNGRRDQVLAIGINAAMQYALSILTDPRREFASLFCRCEYSACRNFFFEKKPEGGGRGARVRKFCTPDHAVEGDREKARERSQKRRDVK